MRDASASRNCVKGWGHLVELFLISSIGKKERLAGGYGLESVQVERASSPRRGRFRGPRRLGAVPRSQRPRGVCGRALEVAPVLELACETESRFAAVAAGDSAE